MIKIFIHLFRFIPFLVLQLLLLFYFKFTATYVPYVYILFILLLPLYIPRVYMLFIGFIVGICIDFFTDTYGVHASATVLVAYLRLFVINPLVKKDLSEVEKVSTRSIGLFPFGFYILILCAIHHFWVIFLWDFSSNSFLLNLEKGAISLLLTMGFAFFLQFFTLPKSLERD